MQEVTVGIGGAAGDGLDKSGDTLAKTAGRLGLHGWRLLGGGDGRWVRLCIRLRVRALAGAGAVMVHCDASVRRALRRPRPGFPAMGCRPKFRHWSTP